jgi:hypothetical protein
MSDEKGDPVEVSYDEPDGMSIGFTYETAPGEYVEFDFEDGKVGVAASDDECPGHMSWLSKEQAVEIAQQILGWAGITQPDAL